MMKRLEVLRTTVDEVGEDKKQSKYLYVLFFSQIQIIK